MVVRVSREPKRTIRLFRMDGTCGVWWTQSAGETVSFLEGEIAAVTTDHDPDLCKITQPALVTERPDSWGLPIIIR